MSDKSIIMRMVKSLVINGYNTFGVVIFYHKGKKIGKVKLL